MEFSISPAVSRKVPSKAEGSENGLTSRLGPTLRPGVFSQFVIAAAITIFVSMGALSYLISGIAREGLLRNAADEGVSMIRIFIEPIAQELESSATFSKEAIERLNRLSANELRGRVLLIKIWTPNRIVAYSTNRDLIGKSLPTTRHPRVMAGKVIATFDDIHDARTDFGYEPDMPLIEVYSPIYKSGTKNIIAVGEVYLDGDLIADEARAIRNATIAIVFTVTLPMAAILFFFVYRSNATTLSHREALVQKMTEAEALARQNDRLRRVAEDTQLTIARSNEQLLGELGQNLHDGPVQLLCLLMLKASLLEETIKNKSGEISADAALKIGQLTDLISQILVEVRTLSSGLVLPELEGLDLTKTLELAISRHQDTTGSGVVFHTDQLPDVSLPLRICLYRVVQEGLNNAFLHAGGRGQKVSASADSRVITVTVEDSGAESNGNLAFARKSTGGLGLRGLRTRVEGFQGTLELNARPEGGTILNVQLPLSERK